MENKHQAFIKGSYILLFTAVLTKLIGALFKIPLSSDLCLGDLGFGYFSAAYDLYLPISTLAVSGFPVAISRIVADYVANERYNEIDCVLKASKKILVLVSVAEFLLISALIYPILKFTDTTGQGIYSLLAVLPSVFISAILSLYRGYFEGLANMKPTAVSNIIEAVGKLVLGFSFAFIFLKLTENVAIAAAGALIGINIGLLFSLLYIYTKYRLNKKSIEIPEKVVFDANLTRSIICVVIPVGLASLAGSFVALVDTLTVRMQLSALVSENPTAFEYVYKSLINESNLTEISFLPTVLYGIKSKAFTLFNIVLTLTMALGISAVPTITEFKSVNDNKELLANVNSSMKLTTLICFPIASGFIFIGKDIMYLLFGNAVSSQIGSKMLVIYGFTAVFAGVSIVMGNILQGMGRYKKVFLNIFIGIAIKIILNIVLTINININIYGCCISTLICYLIIFVLNLLTFYRDVKVLPNKTIFIKPFIASVLCGTTAFYINMISQKTIFDFISIVVAGFVYFAVLFTTGYFDIDDLSALPFGNKILNMCKSTKKQ